MQTFEVNIDELGVSQLYLNQRKLEAVREKTMAEARLRRAQVRVSVAGRK
jgi:hypothetical protein